MNRREQLYAILLLAFALAIFLFGLGSPGLYDPHESRSAEVAREMLARGDWLTPHLNDARYLDKPPLFYWLISLSYTVFGVSEFSARLPIAMAALGGVLVTWSIGRQLFNGRVGFFAGLVLTTSLGYFIFSRQLLPDLLLSLFTTLSFSLFLRGFSGHHAQKGYALLFYASLALAVLTKGLFGLFPLFVIVVYLLLIGRLRQLRTMVPVAGGLLFAILTVPWHLIMGWRNEGYVWHYFVNEHLLRFIGRRDPIDYVSLPLPVFLFLLFLWFVPWSAFLPLAVATSFPRRGKELDREAHGSLLLLLWAGTILVFFSVSQARLYQYALPAVPALALLIGKSLDDRLTGKVSSTTGPRIATIISLLLPTLALLLIPAYVESSHHVGLRAQTAALSRVFFAVVVVGSGLASLAFSRRLGRFALPALVCSMIAAFFIVHQGLILLEPMQSSKALAALINPVRKPGERVVFEVEKDEPFEYESVSGLAFYTGQKVYLLRRRDPPKFPLPLKAEERFLLSEREFYQLWRSGGRVYLVTDSFRDADGILDSRSPFHVLGHVGNRWVLSSEASSNSFNQGVEPSTGASREGFDKL